MALGRHGLRVAGIVARIEREAQELVRDDAAEARFLRPIR